MNPLSYKGFEGTADVDMELDVCRGKILFIDDLVTYEAESPGQLRKEFESAVDDYLDTCAQIGKDPQKPFKGTFNVRVSPDLHRAAAVRAAHEHTSLNEVVARAIDCYLNSRADVNHHLVVHIEDGLQSVNVSPSQDVAWQEIGSAHVRH